MSQYPRLNARYYPNILLETLRKITLKSSPVESPVRKWYRNSGLHKHDIAAANFAEQRHSLAAATTRSNSPAAVFMIPGTAVDTATTGIVTGTAPSKGVSPIIPRI
jgi:hypothetical protein